MYDVSGLQSRRLPLLGTELALAWNKLRAR